MSALRSLVQHARFRSEATTRRSPGSKRFLSGAVVFSLALGFLAGVSIAGAQVAQAVPAATRTLNYTATLSTSGQSMWGPGSAAPPSDQTTTLFDQSWNQSGSVNEEGSFVADPCYYLTFGIKSCPYTSYFGGKISGSTTGELGLAGTLHGATGGTVGVNDPLAFSLTGPANDSFAPGDSVVVSTTAPAVSSGATITSTSPDFSSVSLDGTFGFHADASGEACFVSCGGGSILDFTVPVTTGSILDLSKSQLTSLPGLGYSKCFGAAEANLFGTSTYQNEGNFCADSLTGLDSGYLALPDVTLGDTIVGSDNGLTASGHNQYAVVPISAVSWLDKVVGGLPTGFPTLGGSFNGVGASITTLQDVLSAVVTRHQEMAWTQRADLTLDFGQSLDYVVLDASNGVVRQGTGSSATFPLGDKVRFRPMNALTITPTVSIGDNTFSNHTYDTVAGANQITALSLSASVGDVAVNLGPVYDSGLQDLGSSNIDRVHNSWKLDGFNSVQLASFTVTPDPNPIATPKTVTPVEGAGYSGVVASYVDPDPSAAAEQASTDTTALIAWGDGTAPSVGTITGTGSGYDVTGTHTYAEEGSYAVTVTTTDTDTPTLHAVASSRANVSDAALTVTAQPQLNTTEGAPSSAGTTVARFTDADPAGTVSDYSATIDWGDGTSTSSGTVGAGSGGEFVVSAPTHTYAEEGTPTVTVTIVDSGGASIVAHSPMRTVDAALHSVGVTNGTQAGTGTPVLYWPGAGNAVVARLTDDDPLGTPSDYTAVVHWGDGTQSSAVVSSHTGGGFDVTGNHAYSNANLGFHTVTVDVTDEGGSTTETTTRVLAYNFANGGTFAIGDRTLTAAAPSYASAVTFWSSSWNKDNSLSGGQAPSAFKGFVSHPPVAPAPPAFLPSGTTWTTVTGSSSVPPLTVPSYMLVLVTSKVTQTSSTVASGSVVHWVIIRTNAGYGPSAGQRGTGTIVAVLN